MRVIFTGSRFWTDRRIVGAALDRLALRAGSPASVTIVHGAARGLDSIAAAEAEARGMVVIPFRADWSRGDRGGPERNARMIAAGADLVVAFPVGKSSGTRGCIALARAAGIRVAIYSAADGWAQSDKEPRP